MTAIPSIELIGKMRQTVEIMEQILRDDRRKPQTQIADINTWCWAMVDLAVHLQQSVGDELHGLEDNE